MKKLSVFSLVMINVIAVDNLRSLTAGAEYGLALIFFYLLAAALFFIPTILITAELTTAWPDTGGVYIWVREAFGHKAGFLTIWLQWIYNVVWYPTIFAFIAGIIAYLVDPTLINNKFYMLSIILGAFWAITALNCLGLRAYHWLSTIGALIGTIFPMLLIAILGLIWLLMRKATAITFSIPAFFPNLASLKNLAFLTNILFGLMGMEMSAVHAGDVNNPKKDYPRALLYSTCIILVTLITACLAITMVIPVHQLNLVSGFMDAFSIFFHAYGLSWFIPILAVLIILGSLSGAATWIIGPARGLLIAGQDHDLPRFLVSVNKKDMPIGILLTQGLIVTVLCVLFLVMPSVNSSYWLLSNLTAQLALIFYLFMFVAALRLRYKYPEKQRTFKVPGGKIGLWLVCVAGIFACVSAIVLGFLPPTQVNIGSLLRYEGIMLGGMLVCILPAFLLHYVSKRQLRLP